MSFSFRLLRQSTSVGSGANGLFTFRFMSPIDTSSSASGNLLCKNLKIKVERPGVEPGQAYLNAGDLQSPELTNAQPLHFDL